MRMNSYTHNGNNNHKFNVQKEDTVFIDIYSKFCSKDALKYYVVQNMYFYVVWNERRMYLVFYSYVPSP